MNLLTVAIIIGIVKAIKEYVPEVNGLVTVAVAVAIGAVAGYFNLVWRVIIIILPRKTSGVIFFVVYGGVFIVVRIGA